MKRSCLIVGALVLLLAVNLEAKKNSRQFWSRTTNDNTANDETIDIDTESSGQEEPLSTYDDDEDVDDEYDVTTASGDGISDNDDYDYGIEEESGSGALPLENIDDDDDDTTESPVTTQKATTKAPLSPCQYLRENSKYSTYKPECTAEGEFEIRQCHPVSLDCWCVDEGGKEIKGSLKHDPVKPDCMFGENLKTCVFQYLQYSQGLLVKFKPNCTDDGEFYPVQCQGNQCWCVDDMGNNVLGSFVDKPQIPKCTVDEDIIVEQVNPVNNKAPSTEKPNKEAVPNYTVITDSDSKEVDDNDISVGTIDETITLDVDDGEENKEVVEEDNATGQGSSSTKLIANDDVLLGQPGILAAIIGGAVVGLLCMVLLVMFVVYRMRKKDEGSYALEEQKYQNYSYAKAPDKEFYA